MTTIKPRIRIENRQACQASKKELRDASPKSGGAPIEQVDRPRHHRGPELQRRRLSPEQRVIRPPRNNVLVEVYVQRELLELLKRLYDLEDRAMVEAGNVRYLEIETLQVLEAKDRIEDAGLNTGGTVPNRKALDGLELPRGA